MAPFKENRKFDIQFNEPEHASELTPDWDVLHYQIGRGDYKALLQGLYTSRLQIALCRYKVDIFEQGAIPKGTGVIGFPFHQAQSHYCGGVLLDDEIPVLCIGEEYEFKTKGTAATLTMAVDMDLLQQVARERTGHELSSLITNKRLNIHPDDRIRIRTRLTALLTSLLKKDQLHLDVRQQVLLERVILETVFTHVRDKNRDLYPVQRLQSALLAREYIVNNPHSDLDISRLCQVTGCARETLHKGFRERYGMSPGRYIRTIRLNGARAELLQTRQYGMVADIAMKWGFSHLGRFSRYYRQLFGESPRETANRNAVPPAWKNQLSPLIHSCPPPGS